MTSEYKDGKGDYYLAEGIREQARAEGVVAGVSAVRRAVLFTRTRLGTPPEKIRMTDLLAILDAIAKEPTR